MALSLAVHTRWEMTTLVVNHLVASPRLVLNLVACSLALTVQVVACGLSAIRPRMMDVLAGPTVTALCAVTLVIRGEYLGRQVFVTAVLGMWGIRLAVLHARRPAKRVDPHAPAGVTPNLCLVRSLWAWAVSSPAILLNTLDVHSTGAVFPYAHRDLMGVCLALGGGLFEAAADLQKERWHATISSGATHGSCMQAGLWSWSRHPNYAGQLVMHTGIFILSVGHTSYWCMTGVLFSALSLILLDGGMCTLERDKENLFFGKTDYLKYRARTSPLLPIPPTVYSALHWRVKKIFLLELDVYAKGSLYMGV